MTDKYTEPTGRLRHPVARLKHPVVRLKHPVAHLKHPVVRLRHLSPLYLQECPAAQVQTRKIASLALKLSD